MLIFVNSYEKYNLKINKKKVKTTPFFQINREGLGVSKSKWPGNMKFVNIQLKTGAFQVANLLFKLILQLDFQKQFSTWERKN